MDNDRGERRRSTKKNQKPRITPMEGKNIFSGKTKDGKDLTIRYPKKDDAQEMCDYINELSKEQTFIRLQGEEVSLEDETKYLNSMLESIENKKSVCLLAIVGEKLVGITDVKLKEKVEAHEAVFGISVLNECRGQGIGKSLLENILEEAKKHLEGIRLITLGVFSNNGIACSFYEKFGFKKYGVLPGGIRHKDQFIDHVYMYKEV